MGWPPSHIVCRRRVRRRVDATRRRGGASRADAAGRAPPSPPGSPAPSGQTRRAERASSNSLPRRGPGCSGGARRSRRSPTRRSCRSPRVATTCSLRSATTRSSSWPARPARARRPSCPSSASSSGAACAGRSPTPSRDGSPRGPWRSGSRTSSTSRSAAPSATRSASTTEAREDTLVRLVTDGLLLAEIRRDPLLRRYDTIIVDEAHERSLNIDFLLGCLHRILPRRPDLKLIITSATIDPERFSEHFGGAPIVEVSGRTYPVEVRYRPPREDEELLDALADTVEELLARARRRRARVLLRRARDPRRGRAAHRAAAGRTSRCCRCTRGSRPPSSRRSSAASRAANAARRAGDERRRDVADGPRHPLRRRHRRWRGSPATARA